MAQILRDAPVGSRTVIPPRPDLSGRASLLMDAPEGAVRRALGRTDVWTRTARALGARAEVAGERTGPRAPLRAGDLIRIRRQRARPRASDGAGTVRRRSTTPWLERLQRAPLLPPRSLILRVEDIPELAEPTDPTDPTDSSSGGAQTIAPPLLRLVAGPLRECRIALTTAWTGEGTLVTVDCQVQASPSLLTPLLRRRVRQAARMLLGITVLAAREIQVVVAGAVITDARVLAARRTRPPDLAGRWELPGGKCEPGETEQEALTRELGEELGVVVTVSNRVGDDVDLGDNRVLRCYQAAIQSGRPVPTDHDAVRWVAADELETVDWLAADRELLVALRRLLRE